MGEEETEKNPEEKIEVKHDEAVTREKGGARTMPFIFANEVCERLAVTGFSTNMMTYLTQELHMPMIQAANTLTNFAGTSTLTTFAGAFIADSYAGRFWTITVSSIIYLTAMICLTLSAVFTQLKPPPCKVNQVCKEATERQLSVLYVSLVLMAIGSGGLRPCVVAFGADQYDETNPKQKTKSWNFFNWYFFVMGVSILFAVTVIVYIQDNAGWGWGFGVPTVVWFFSIVTFVVGYPIYQIFGPSGSPFTRLSQVIVAALKKRKLSKVSDPTTLYQNDELDASIIIQGKLLHTKQLKFLDKAAIVTEKDQTASGTPNLWKLCTVHRVEELKSIIRMGPIWASAIMLVTASSQQATFTLQQARTMDRHLSKSIQIPPASMSVFTVVSMLLTLALYDRLLIPIARFFTGIERGISYLHRMAIGYVIAIIATFVSGFVEIKRKNVASAHGLTDLPSATIPISVYWLVPQYALHGVAEAFMSVGHLEYFFDQSPESMRSTATAFYWTAIAAGGYTSTLLVTLVHKYTAGPDGSNWLPNYNLNKGKLEYFYWLITFLQLLNIVYYMICVKFYTFKAVQRQKKEEQSEAELALVQV